MCGIFGTTIRNVKTDDVFSRISHRGPDDKGEWKNEKILLCHTRLSIIDLSNGGHQPMINSSGNLSMVFNGEVYNYAELKMNLEAEGAVFKSKSDTEVILVGYEKYGSAFFEKLRGMWAVAIYDSKDHTLLLSRDQFGIKPLYYAVEGQNVTFSSEVRSITPYLSKVSPNTSKYFLYYNLGYFPGELTSFTEVKKVLPGQIITFNLSDNSKKSNFISLPKENVNVTSEKEAVSLIQDGLSKSLEKHFVSDVPVAILLSGGNDSSFIASLAKDLGKEPTCFNVSIEGSLDNEYAEKVAKHLDLPYEKVVIKQSEFESQYKKVWDILDQPTSDVSFIPTTLVYSSIKGKSKVVLSGEGGDEFFGGYLRHKNFSHFETMGFKKAFPEFKTLSRMSLKYINPIVSRVRKYFSFLESLGSTYLYSSRQIDLSIRDGDTLSFMNEYYNHHPYKDSIQPNLFFDLFMYIPDSLMYKGDTSSMAYSIENRVPFIDKEFFRVVSQIDPKLRLSSEYVNKRIMKSAMEKYLPHDLIYRKKTGFGININRYASLVLRDLEDALQYHLQNKEKLGITHSNLEKIISKENAGIILRKYPRFAYSIISNYKVMSRYSL